MSPKETAEELYNKMLFCFQGNIDEYTAKQCALIAVDEIMKECYNWAGGENIEYDIKRFQYWEEVKQEIEKL